MFWPTTSRTRSEPSVYSRLLRLNPVARQSAQPEDSISYYEKMSLLEAKRTDEPN